jgi:hypothetical protein
MPCFEGLFPPTAENVILDLLFMLATWHALAKLRMHTTSTLSFLMLLQRVLAKSFDALQITFAPSLIPKKHLQREQRVIVVQQQRQRKVIRIKKPTRPRQKKDNPTSVRTKSMPLDITLP